MDPRIESLPEAALLDFLLQSSYIRDLRQIYDLHRRVDDHQFYFGNYIFNKKKSFCIVREVYSYIYESTVSWYVFFSFLFPTFSLVA